MVFLVSLNLTYMDILYESIIYVNHRGHDRGKNNPGVSESDWGGWGGGWGGGITLSHSSVFLTSVVASMVHIYDGFI